jgi:hypothetical protein
MQFQLLNPPPHDACSIPWDSVVLPLGTPGGHAQGGPNKSLYLGLDSVATAWGLFYILDSRPCQVFIAGILEEAQTVSVLLPQHGTDLTLRGNFSVKLLASQSESASAAMVRGKERESSTDCIWEDTTAPFESCRNTDMNRLLASITKWEDMGCTPGMTPEYSSLLQTLKSQKPRVSQGLYPILLLALSASMTSAYTSLGVSQDSNPQRQLLKVSVYHSATSAVLFMLDAVLIRVWDLHGWWGRGTGGGLVVGMMVSSSSEGNRESASLL